MPTFSVDNDAESSRRRICKRHGETLQKHMKPDGEMIWTCPKEKCSYKENEDGEMI